MINGKINKEVYEQYVDATVALFMEYYSANLLEDIRTELGETDQSDIVFPRELDDRCRGLIKKQCASRKRKDFLKSATTGLRYVAVLAIAVLSLSSFLFVTVEAFRISIINFYVEQNDGHWDISGLPDTQQNEDLDINDPLAGMIPEQYKLVFSKGDSLDRVKALYEDADRNQIFFSAVPGTNILEVDSEDAQISQKCIIGGCQAILVAEENKSRIAWINEKTSTIFTLIVDNLTDSEATMLAERIIHLISD